MSSNLILKNTASQKLTVFVWDSTTGLPKTGDAANLTASVSIDYAAAADLTDTSATEIDSTKEKGKYLFDLAQSETNGDILDFSVRSSTSNITGVALPSKCRTLAGANIGTTQPINFHGTGGTAYVKSDLTEIADTAWASTTLFTLASHDPGATIGTGTSTLTQTQVTGGAYALNSASFSFNTAFDFTSTQKTSLNAATPVATLSGDFTSTMKTSIGTAVAASAVASVTGNVGGNVTGSVGSISGVSFPSGFSTLTATSIASTTLASTLANTYSGTAVPTLDQAIMYLHQKANNESISGTTVTIKKPDNITTAATLMLDDATNPTAMHRAT